MTTIRELEQFSPGHGFYDVGDQLKQHIYRRSEQAFEAGDRARDAILTRADLDARQTAIRAFIHRSLGGLPLSDTPLEAQTVGVVAGDGFRIEKVVFQSRPREYVTANLYLPDGLREPRGAVQFLCGHHREAKHAPEYQSVCQVLAHAGLIVLAQDPIGQGERLGYYEPALQDSTVPWGTTEHDYTGAQCLALGESIARYFLHDAMRGLDYLRSRPEVDPDRIGVTGNSGGGTQSCLMMLADPRLAAAVPATFLMSRHSYLLAGGAQDAEQIWPGFTAAGFDHEDVLIAMAPRPVRVLAVTSDFFPIEGTRRTVQRCRRFWELCGQTDGLDLVEDDSTHAYTPALARAAARFFARHLLDRDADEAWQPAPFEPQKLWCTSSGQVRGEIAASLSLFEINRPRVEALEQARLAQPEAARRSRALEWLRERVCHGREPCELNPRFYRSDRVEELRVRAALWWSQENLFNHGYAFRSLDASERDMPVTLAVWPGGTDCLQPHLEWIRRTCADGRTVLVLDVAGTGALTPRSFLSGPADGMYRTLHKLATDLIWLDDDLPALRTHDVLRALDMIERWPGMDADQIDVYAYGCEGLYGRLAGALDARIRRAEVVDGLGRYADWVAARHYDTRNIYGILMRGMLVYFDLAEIDKVKDEG